MGIEILAVIVAAAIACLVLTLCVRKPKEEVVSKAISQEIRIGIQIICGNCAGEKDRPVKTYLGRRGGLACCDTCEGVSFVLAGPLEHQFVQAKRNRNMAESRGIALVDSPRNLPGNEPRRDKRIQV